MKFAKCKTPKKLISSLYSPTMRKEPANPLQREQRVVLTDERFGRLIGEIVEIQSCWSYFELRIRVSQGRFKNMALKVGKDVTEIRLAKPTPLSPTLF